MDARAEGLVELAHNRSLEYFLVSLQFDRIWVGGHHGYCAHNCDFEKRMRTIRGLIKTFVWWHDLDVFLLLPRDGPVIFVPRSDWWIG